MKISYILYTGFYTGFILIIYRISAYYIQFLNNKKSIILALESIYLDKRGLILSV